MKEGINLEYWQRISRQTIIWTQLNHPNVLPFLGYQVVDGEPRLVSPWIDRGTLETYLDTHPDLSNIDRLRLVSASLVPEAFFCDIDRPG